MAIKPFAATVFGKEILIKARAYDPRDIFRGDYIQLSYDINEISIEKIDKDVSDLLKNQTGDLYKADLYVSLTKNGKYHVVKEVSLHKPKESIYIKAKLSYVLWDEKEASEIRGIFVEYPLDKYFVEENTGKELEEKVQRGEAYSRIKVFGGYAVLVDVLTEE